MEQFLHRGRETRGQDEGGAEDQQAGPDHLRHRLRPLPGHLLVCGHGGVLQRQEHREDDRAGGDSRVRVHEEGGLVAADEEYEQVGAQIEPR